MDTPTLYQGFNILPNELIAEILLLLFNQYATCYHDERSKLPRRLQRVCRKWKAVISQTPALWTVLSLDNLGVPSLDGFNESMRLSGLRELDVVIKLDNLPTFPKAVDVSPEGLHFPRWRSIHFVLLSPPKKSQQAVYNAIFTRPMPRLHELSFTAHPQLIGNYLVSRMGLPQNPLPPSLRRLILTDYSVDFGMESVGGLEYLEIERVDNYGLFEAFIQFIQRSPRLRTLRLRSPIIGEEWWESSEEWYQTLFESKGLHLPELESLSISRMSQWEGVLLLSLIEAPLLTSLELDFHEDPAGPDELAWEPPRRSLIGFPSLRILKLGAMGSCVPIRSHILMRLLTSTKAMRQLILDGDIQPSDEDHHEYSPELPAILEQLQAPQFREMWAGVEDFASRNCSPITLHHFYEHSSLPSLKSFRVSAWEIDVLDGQKDGRLEGVHSQTASAVEKLRVLPVFGRWKQEDCSSWT